MVNLELVAAEMLKCAAAWEPGARLIGNVTAAQVATVAAHVLETCPKCGATAWVNIDCDLCTVCTQLLSDDPPEPLKSAQKAFGGW